MWGEGESAGGYADEVEVTGGPGIDGLDAEDDSGMLKVSEMIGKPRKEGS